jgi:hypothetical protein
MQDVYHTLGHDILGWENRRIGTRGTEGGRTEFLGSGHSKEVSVVRRAVVAVCALVLAASLPGVGWAQAGRIKVRASFGAGSYSIDDVNDFMGSKGHYLHDFEVYMDDPYYYDVNTAFSSDDLEGGALLSGAVEYGLTDQLSVGVEFLPLSASGGYNWRIEVWDEYYYEYYVFRQGLDAEASANLVSLYGVYSVPLGSTGASIRLGGGAGYLFGGTLALDWHGDFDYTYWDRQGRQDEEWSGSLEATGSGMAFHALVGIEYPIMPQLLLTGDVAYRFAAIDELEVDKVRRNNESMGVHPVEDETEEGEVLKWVDYNGDFDETEWVPVFSTGAGSEVGLDFSGLYFTLGIAYVF